VPQPLRLLIVEDSPDDVELLQRALRRGGLEISFAVVDSEALMSAALEREHWDVITSDLSMPGFSAPAALALAKRIRPHAAFVVVSGETNLEQAVSLIKQGADDYVQKRDLDRASAAIHAALRAAQMRRERDARAPESSEARYKSLFDTAHDAILIIDADSGRVIDANPSLARMTGRAREEFVGLSMLELGTFADGQAVEAVLAELPDTGCVQGEDFLLRTRDRGLLEVEFVGNAYLAGDTRLIQANLREFAARRRRDRRAQPFADYDALTGLPNRMLFHDRLDQAIKLAARERHEMSLLCLDLDHLRSFYGTLGDGAVDEILKQAAATIRHLLRHSDTVGRIDGEQFAVLLPKIARPQDATAVAGKLTDALLERLRLGGRHADHLRVGIATFSSAGPNAEALLQAARSDMRETRSTASSSGAA